MNKESNSITAYPLEDMRARIANTIETARSNPISEERLKELEDRLEHLKKAFVERGSREEKETIEEDKIEKEILHSSALADNLVEFKEMLKQISEKYSEPPEWVTDLLAHENAHANIAEITAHEWVGYATVFIKDETGQLSGIQPLHFLKPELSWEPKEAIQKSIEVLEAPEKYGNKLSPSDEENITKERELLEKIRLRQQSDLKRIAEIREGFKNGS